MDACCRVIPRLKEAPVLEDCVGLRPMRQTVRLEKDILRCGDKTIKVVHNYGHGAKGVCFSWGCAIQATKLVKELLSKVGP
uniref:D-amino-acid oxidase-like n=1 Tax=Saccoglossus kowalevskii TaxID=10224 RepID=A0ABM0MT53_SACKO|nr:PREDICTED: D-amino-acid oxidase-like [Saccoglossus kowalevskii]